MALNPVNGSDTLAAGFTKVNANDTYLEGLTAGVDGRTTTLETNATALAIRVTNIEGDPDVRRFDYNPDTSTGTSFAYYGGRYEDSLGTSYYLGNGAVAIATGTNYIEMNFSTGVVTSNQVGFTVGRMKMWVAVSNGTVITSLPTDFRSQAGQPGGSLIVGFGYNPATTTALTYGFYGGTVRTATGLVTVAAGTIALADASANYVELNAAGTAVTNTSGWTLGFAPVALVATSAGVITAVDASVRGALIVGLSGGGGGGFFDPATWMMT